MKVTVNSASEKKLVGVLGADGVTIFLPNQNHNGSYVINSQGKIDPKIEMSLVGLLNSDIKRKPIYEGDSITLQF